jgi:hypothetical protein
VFFIALFSLSLSTFVPLPSHGGEMLFSAPAERADGEIASELRAIKSNYENTFFINIRIQSLQEK